MSFRIVEGPVRLIEAEIDATDTLYVGQIVYSASDGVLPMGAAAGVADTTNPRCPWGIVVGSNLRTPVYNSTWKANSDTGVAAQASVVARDTIRLSTNQGAIGDKVAKVQIALIDPTSVIEGPIYNAAYGTAPTLLTTTAGSTDGGVTGPTTNACEFTPVADLASIYWRTGANAGTYRITTDTSTTVPTHTHAMVADIAVGDTAVRVPMRTQGTSTVQFDTESMYIDSSAGPVAVGTNRYMIEVVSLDLSEAGKEKVRFRFGGDHFSYFRA